MATDETNEKNVEETETVEAQAEDTAVAEPATQSPVRDSGPVEGVSGEPGGSPGEAPPAAKKQRSGKHVPRSQRRTRSKPKRETAATRKPITRQPKPEHGRQHGCVAGRHQRNLRGQDVSTACPHARQGTGAA